MSHPIMQTFATVHPHLFEFIVFGIKQARASIFAGSFLALLFISNYLPDTGLARYDFLFLAAVLIQIIMYWSKLETKDELKVIFLFHIIGLILEIYKTSPGVGSWSYPEEGYFKFMNVPLYSGFMYAAVGSYISQAWKILKLELTHYNQYGLSIVLGSLIYLNFFTNHFVYDIRYFLLIGISVFFWKTRIYFTITNQRRWMPMNLGFALVAFFIWIAENISTYWGAWKYPDQIDAWSVVSIHKIISWFLMVIISFILVAYLKHVKQERVKKE